MAKKKQIFIDVVVDDKGTTQRLAVDSGKLEKALIKTNKGTLDTQRQMRGAAAMSSNLTKNFSKMTQGISGGIVPAYAELAARVFAVTAAFRFLQDAADTRNLIAGQEAFGAMIGTNYAGITRALQEATDGQLKFKDAAQATAIGTAAGLTEKQLVGLSTAAKNVSFALGRDLTDSFNRLIRGVTKAEPELLDELGIILRLEPATKAYADSIGKTAKDLNAFERSQAVANFVLDEAEKKFDKIAKIMDEDAFAVAQFGKAFDDLLNTLKVNIAQGITPVIQFLSKNVGSLVAVFGLLALPLIRSIVPNLDKFGEAAKEAAEDASKFAASAQKDFDRLSAKAATLGASQKEVAKQADNLAKSAGVTAKGAGANTARGFIAGSGQPTARGRANADKALKNAEAQLRNHAKVQNGIFKGMDAAQVKSARAAFQMRERILKKHEMVVRRSAAGMKITMDKFFAGVQVKSAKAFGFMARQAKRAAKVIDFAFKGAGLLGLGLLLVDLGKMAMDAFFPMSKAAKAAAEELEELTGKLDENANFLRKVNEMRSTDGLLTFREELTQVGNAVKQSNLEDLISQVNNLNSKVGTKDFDKYKSSIQENIDELVKLDPVFKGLIENMDNEKNISAETVAAMRLRASHLVTVSDATQNLGQASKDTAAEIAKITNAIVKIPLQTLVDTLQREYDMALIVSLEFDKPKFQAELQAARDELERLKTAKTGQDFENRQVKQQTSRGVRTTTRKVAVGPKKRTAEDDARQKAQQAVVDGLEDEEATADRLKTLTETRLRIATTAQTKQLGLQAKILTNRQKIAELDKASMTFEAQKARLTESELNAENKILSAQQKLNSAKLAQSLLEAENLADDDPRLLNAKEAVRLAGEEVDIAKDQKQQIIDINNLKRSSLDIDKARLNVAIQMRQIETALRLAQNQAKFDTTGAGSIGRNVFDIARTERQQRIRDAEDEVTLAKKAQTDAQLALNQAEDDPKKIEAANKLIDAAKVRLDLANKTLETEQRSTERLIQQVAADNQLNAARIAGFSLNPAEQAFQQFLTDNKLQMKDLTVAEVDALREQIKVQEKQKILMEGLTNISNAFSSSISQGLEGLASGTMTFKEVFANMAKSVLSAISQMISQMITMKILMAAFPGLGGGSPGDAATINTGAQFANVARYGGVFEGYRSGGIARGRQAGYPAILHGTEAVIPMPNKKSIPVEFLGGGNQSNNNITINVSSEGNTQSTQSGDQQNADLGRAISMAVQEELQRQKRPGGILSPYGAA